MISRFASPYEFRMFTKSEKNRVIYGLWCVQTQILSGSMLSLCPRARCGQNSFCLWCEDRSCRWISKTVRVGRWMSTPDPCVGDSIVSLNKWMFYSCLITWLFFEEISFGSFLFTFSIRLDSVRLLRLLLLSSQFPFLISNRVFISLMFYLSFMLIVMSSVRP